MKQPVLEEARATAQLRYSRGMSYVFWAKPDRSLHQFCPVLLQCQTQFRPYLHGPGLTLVPKLQIELVDFPYLLSTCGCSPWICNGHSAFMRTALLTLDGRIPGTQALTKNRQLILGSFGINSVFGCFATLGSEGPITVSGLHNIDHILFQLSLMQVSAKRKSR